MSGGVTAFELDEQSRNKSEAESPGARLTVWVHARRWFMSAIQAAERFHAWFKRRIWSSLGPVLVITLAALAIAIALGVVVLLFGRGWWSSANDACQNNDLGCHLGSDAIMSIVLAAFGAWVFLGAEAAAAMSWRRTVKREPEWLFRGWISSLDGLTGAAARAAPPHHQRRWRQAWRRWTDQAERSADEIPVRKTAVGREELAKSVIADLNESHDPQILVGESGAGKTVLLMVIADQLAKQSQVPVAITLRAGTAATIEDNAKTAFKEAVTGTTNFRRVLFRRAHARNDEQAERWWNWLRQRSLITVLVDDFEKDTILDPTRRVQALEGAAHQHLRLVVASRSYGLPPDYRRGRVDIDAIPDHAIIADLEKIAQRPGATADEARDHRLPTHIPMRVAIPGSSYLRRPQYDSERVGENDDDPSAPTTPDAITSLVEGADIGRTPYYLAIARVLADRGLFPSLRDSRNARVTLLDSYRSGLEKGSLSPASGLREGTRRTVLDQLEVVAYVCVFEESEDRSEADIARRARARRKEVDMSYQEGFDLGRRLTVLESRYDGRVHFAHPTTLAYFASVYLRKDWDEKKAAWKALAEHKHLSPIAINAMTLAVAGDPEMVDYACQELLGRVWFKNWSADLDSSEESSREPLALCAAAAEMLATTLPHPDIGLIAEISEASKRVSVVGQRLTAEKKRVVAALNRLEAYEEIWHYARDHQEYPVRREASRLLARTKASHERLIEEFERTINIAREVRDSGQPNPDDNSDLLVELKAVAWILPSVRMAAKKDSPPRCRLNALQELLIDMSLSEELTVQRGLEASVAQGLKLAAQENRGEADSYAQAMLDQTPKFWYSRVMLAQALAMQAVGPKASGKVCGSRRGIRHRLKELQVRDRHPFVRQTAGLCRQALARRPVKDGARALLQMAMRPKSALSIKEGSHERWESFIWSDAAEIVTGVPERLTVKAAQLAGDVVIALNLNAPHDAEMRQRFGVTETLPACLRAGGDRDFIVGRTDPPGEKCPLFVQTSEQRKSDEPGHCACPYFYSSTDLGRKMEARREVSRAFCRHQMVNARPPIWQHDLKVKDLRKFWEHMGELARF
jgi:hypothetical protein